MKTLLKFSRYDERVTVLALQAMILMLQVAVLSPTSGDRGDGTRGFILFRTCVNMAQALGLPRDVDTLYRKESTRFRLKLKQIWFFLYQRDAYVSFQVGLPLAIGENTIDSDSFGVLSAQQKNDLILAKLVRQVCHLVSRKGPKYADEAMSLLSKFQQFDQGALMRLSSDELQRVWYSCETPVMLISRMSLFPGLLRQLFSLTVMHMLCEMITQCCPRDDPQRQFYETLAIKHSVVCMTYTLDLLMLLNGLCSRALSGGALNSGLLRVVEMSAALIALSRGVLARSYLTLFSNQARHVDDLQRLVPARVLLYYKGVPNSINSSPTSPV